MHGSATPNSHPAVYVLCHRNGTTGILIQTNEYANINSLSTYLRNISQSNINSSLSKLKYQNAEIRLPLLNPNSTRAQPTA
jgi:hypothetical protein